MNPALVLADANGNIYDDPDLSMVISRAGQWSLPRREDLVPLPPESELFLLPGRSAVGLDGATGRMETVDGAAVAAFAAPGYTINAHPAYLEEPDAPLLPLFAYGAVGYAEGRFWIAASRVDSDPRQQFAGIKPERIERECRKLLSDWPDNRLVGHIITNCVRRYACPAARNFALGRYEAPLPTSTACNARCVGCISLQDKSSPVTVTPQCRMTFIPTAWEIAEVMGIHAAREQRQPIYSFGQGCEGDPLTNSDLLCESISIFRRGNGPGTINCNSNASRPDVLPDLASAGLTSLRVSLNSARPDMYTAYYRPNGYSFADVAASIKTARKAGLFVSLNLLYFPGITDTWNEIDALAALCADGVSMIQLRNLNIDPVWYPRMLGIDSDSVAFEAPLGLKVFTRRLRKKCPWLRFGYFNPYLGEKAEISAPMPA